MFKTQLFVIAPAYRPVWHLDVEEGIPLLLQCPHALSCQLRLLLGAFHDPPPRPARLSRHTGSRCVPRTGTAVGRGVGSLRSGQPRPAAWWNKLPSPVSLRGPSRCSPAPALPYLGVLAAAAAEGALASGTRREAEEGREGGTALPRSGSGRQRRPRRLLLPPPRRARNPAGRPRRKRRGRPLRWSLRPTGAVALSWAPAAPRAGAGRREAEVRSWSTSNRHGRICLKTCWWNKRKRQIVQSGAPCKLSPKI